MGSFVFLSKERTNSSPSALGEPVGPGPGTGPHPGPFWPQYPPPPFLSCTRPILPPECPGAQCGLGWAPGHVTEPPKPVLGPQPHPLARRALSQMGGVMCRKESLCPSSSRRGGMSCRPGRDFPSLSNKIPGEQAAGFGRAPAEDPPSPARMPGSPGPGTTGSLGS